MSAADSDPKDSNPVPPRPNFGLLGISICGSAASAAKLVAMTKARRSGTSSELKVTKNVPILTGAKDFIVWRTMILGLFVPYVGGRYWHLLESDPSTSVEAYQYIFADSDDQPLDRDEAITHRTADLISIHGLLIQTLHADVLQSVDKETSSGNFDGYRLWVALTSKYGGKDLHDEYFWPPTVGSKRVAESAIKDFQLGALTVTEASQQLQALFTQVFISSGRPYPESDKIEAALAVFNTPRFKAMRTTIQESWQNGHPYTFDQVISRFVGEESLSAVTEQGLAQEDGYRALRSHSARAAGVVGAQVPQTYSRPNPQRRQAKGQSVSCWWCTKSGHQMRACRRRLAGDPPHPNSRVALERTDGNHGQRAGFGVQEASSASSTHARLAALETALHRALRAHNDVPAPAPHFSHHEMHHADHQPRSTYQAPASLASRISERHFQPISSSHSLYPSTSTSHYAPSSLYH
ncbi:hypothetical protein V8E36_007597 [Tilletia maclaganii]